MPDGRPIFVVGAQRSGTTLLRYILSSHPHIYIPPESNFIPRYFGSNPNRSIRRDEAVEIVSGIFSYRMFFKDWKGDRPDPEVFVDSIESLTAENILNAIYYQYAISYEAQRWGDKSPIYSDHLGLLAKIFPQAQFIHIIRDGRDVALSMLSSYYSLRFFYFDLYYAARTWKERVRKAREAGNRLGPDRYYELRYENLATDPKQEIEKICEFLDEEFHENMIQPQSIAKSAHHSKGIHASTRKPLNTASVGKWKTQMSDDDQRLIQSVAGDLLAELGYELRSLGGRNTFEVIRLLGLRMKYDFIQFGKRLAQAGGMFHPTDLLSRHLQPYPDKSTH